MGSLSPATPGELYDLVLTSSIQTNGMGPLAGNSSSKGAEEQKIPGTTSGCCTLTGLIGPQQLIGHSQQLKIYTAAQTISHPSAFGVLEAEGGERGNSLACNFRRGCHGSSKPKSRLSTVILEIYFVEAVIWQFELVASCQHHSSLQCSHF